MPIEMQHRYWFSLRCEVTRLIFFHQIIKWFGVCMMTSETYSLTLKISLSTSLASGICSLENKMFNFNKMLGNCVTDKINAQRFNQTKLWKNTFNLSTYDSVNTLSLRRRLKIFWKSWSLCSKSAFRFRVACKTSPDVDTKLKSPATNLWCSEVAGVSLLELKKIYLKYWPQKVSIQQKTDLYVSVHIISDRNWWRAVVTKSTVGVVAKLLPNFGGSSGLPLLDSPSPLLCGLSSTELSLVARVGTASLSNINLPFSLSNAKSVAVKCRLQMYVSVKSFSLPSKITKFSSVKMFSSTAFHALNVTSWSTALGNLWNVISVVCTSGDKEQTAHTTCDTIFLWCTIIWSIFCSLKITKLWFEFLIFVDSFSVFGFFA